jgi:hypothetical protein
MDRLKEAFAKHNMILENILFRYITQNSSHQMVATIKSNQHQDILSNLYNIGYLVQYDTLTYFDLDHSNELQYHSTVYINFDDINKLVRYLLKDYNFNIQKKIINKFIFC